jgi:hypothetical protein
MPHLAQMSIHRVGIDLVRAAHPAQKVRPMLERMGMTLKVFPALPETQPFNVQTRAIKATGDLLADRIVGQHHNIQTAFKQSLKDIRLEKIHQRKTVICGDKNGFWFSHACSSAINGRNKL